MRRVASLIILFSSFWSMSFSESGNVAHVYTLSRNRLFGVFQYEMDALRFGKIIEEDVTGFFEVDGSDLIEVNRLLQRYLLGELNISKACEQTYRLDDIVFSFYEYYLQFIPYYDGMKKMIFINVYRHGCDKDDEQDKSPAEHLVRVFDGGASFWQIIYDVGKGVFLKLRINGEA